MIIKSIQIVVLLLCLLRATYQSDPKAYYKSWEQLVPRPTILPANKHATQHEMCDGQPCNFYFYIHENPALLATNHNITILLLSGLEGNDTIGPEVLLASYGQLTAARIIYFPLANPSGFSMATSATYPRRFSVSEDFPLKGNSNCNRTSAFRILSYLYLHYSIDLSVYLHEGSPVITYSWHQSYGQPSSYTQDDAIYRTLSNTLKYYYNQDIAHTKLIEMQSGPGLGSAGQFVDWAYGTTKNFEIMALSCGGKPLKKQLGIKMSGLVFQIGLGTVNQSQPNSRRSIINKGRLLLHKIVSVASPYISVSVQDNNMTLQIKGCIKGVLHNITLIDYWGTTFFSKNLDVIVNGDIVQQKAKLTHIDLPFSVPQNSILKFTANFNCSNSWAGRGSTVFANTYEYSWTGNITTHKNDSIDIYLFKISSEYFHYFIVIVILFSVLLGLGYGASCLRNCLGLLKTRGISQVGESFQCVEDLNSYPDSIQPNTYQIRHQISSQPR